MSNNNKANHINSNDGRTPLGEASTGNQTAVPISNPYKVKQKVKPQLQTSLPTAAQAADENVTNDDSSHGPSNSSPATEATPAKPLHPPSAPSSVVNDSMSTTSTIDTKSSDEMDALQLLNLLQRDYQALEKKSIKSCLRSKHFPCPEVSHIMEQYNASSLTVPLLQSALQALLRNPKFLGSFSELSKATTTDHPATSSLWFMTRMGTAIRFLQLLLVSKSIIDPQVSAPMILGLLQTVTTMMKESLQLYCSNNNNNNNNNNTQSSSQESDDNDEDTEDLYTRAVHENSYHAPQVATFAVAFLLRTKTLFLNYRPEFLCALWKSVESLSEPLMTTSKESPSSIQCALSIELLKDAIQGLCGIAKDFFQQLVATILTTLKNGATPVAMHPQQLKLASFFLARLSTFVKFTLESDQTLEGSVVEEILSLLVCLRGLPMAALANNNNNNNNNNQNNTTKPLLDSCRKVFVKAEKCLSLLLTTQTKRDQSSDVDVGIRSSNIKLLLGMNHASGILASVTQNLSSDIATFLSKDAFYIGKIESLTHTLLQCTNQQYPDRSQAEKVPLLWTEESTVNLVLAISEHLIFDIMPMCYHLFTDQALSSQAQEQSAVDQLLDGCLRSISDVLFLCETSAPCMTSNADRGVASLHRLLLIWLMPVKNKLPVLHHPLTRECIIAVVHFHSTRLSQFQSTATTTTCPSFVTFLVKIFFDARTFTHHRATLAVVIQNLLTSQSFTLTQQLHHGISKEYAKKIPLTCSLHNGKRDRNGRDKKDDRLLQSSWDAFTAEDIRIIGSVLSLLPTSVIPNLDCDIERFCLEVAPFGQGIKGRPSQPTPNTIKRAIFVLAFLEAVLLEDYTRKIPQSKLRDVSGGKGAAEVQHDIIAWFLYLWNKEFSNGKRKHVNQKRLASLAILGRSIFHLVAYNCDQTGVSARKAGSVLLTQQQMQCVLKLMQICTGPSLVDRASDSPMHEPPAWPYKDVSLMHLVWEVSGLLGNIVKQFPETSVDGVLQGLVVIFQNLLGSDTIWSFQAHTIGSLHSFSQLLPKSHSHLLSTCIRKKKQKSLLQCRIQGFAFEYEKSIQKEGSKKKSKRTFTSIKSLLSKCSRDLEFLTRSESCESIGRLLRSTCTGGISQPEKLSIALGSYFLTMPTQDGRKAIVIFPPEESSLRDIRFMMGSGEDEEVEGECSQVTTNLGVQRLRHVAVSGGSCKMMLKPA